MKKKCLILSIFLVAILILAGFSTSVCSRNLNLNKNLVQIEVNRYFGNKDNPIISEVSFEEAEEIKQILIYLNEAIENNDEESISNYEKILNEKGIFGGSYQKFLSKNKYLEIMKPSKYSGLIQYFEKNGDDISNYLCFFNAIGQGVIHFTLGIKVLEAIIRIVENATSPIAQLVLLLALLPFYALVFLLTHLIPFRILMPVGIIEVTSGTISSIGLQGSKKLVVEEEPVMANVSWFTGITINLAFGEEAEGFLFVSGIAAEVSESNI